MFHYLDIEDRLLKGELRLKELRRRPPGQNFGQPPGTDSVIYRIVDRNNGKWVAVVHRYERPDGTTTLYDPKRIWDGPATYYC